MGRLLRDTCRRPARGADGRDEFVAVVTGLDEAGANALLARLARAAEANEGGAWQVPLSFSAGLAWRREGEGMDQLLARADRNMYRSKRAFHAPRRSRRGEPRHSNRALISSRAGPPGADCRNAERSTRAPHQVGRVLIGSRQEQAAQACAEAIRGQGRVGGVDPGVVRG